MNDINDTDRLNWLEQQKYGTVLRWPHNNWSFVELQYEEEEHEHYTLREVYLIKKYPSFSSIREAIDFGCKKSNGGE